MKLRVLHRTVYSYDEPVTTSYHEARLSPREHEHQRTLAHQIDVLPRPALRRRRFDYFGNRVLHFALAEPHRSLEVIATSDVDVRPAPALDLEHTPPWEDLRDRLRSDRRRDALDAYQMTFASHHVNAFPGLVEYAARSFTPRRPVLDAVRELTRRIHADFRYDPDATHVGSPLTQVFADKRGVCQDFAHLMIGALRAVGLPGRYVSGYLLTRPPPGKPRLVGADASHAWVATWVPELGWIEFDPTNDLVVGLEHVGIARGRDFADVTPIRGVILGGGNHTLAVAVDVAPSEGEPVTAG